MFFNVIGFKLSCTSGLTVNSETMKSRERSKWVFVVCLDHFHCPDSGRNAEGRLSSVTQWIFLPLVCKSLWVFYLNMETITGLSTVIAGVQGRMPEVSLVLTFAKVDENLTHTAVLNAWRDLKGRGAGTVRLCFRNGGCLVSWVDKATECALMSSTLGALTLHLPGITQRLHSDFRTCEFLCSETI